MELNTEGQKDGGQQPPQPLQPSRHGIAKSTGQEIAATVVAGGSHDHTHIIVHRPPRDQLPRNSQPYPTATNRHRAVMENSDQTQNKYGNFDRNLMSSNTNIEVAYTPTREANPHIGLRNQEGTGTNKTSLDTHGSMNPEKPNKRQLPQTRTQSGEEEFDIIQEKWRDLTERKKAQEVETAAMLKALETSLFAKEEMPTNGDQQPVKERQDCRPGIPPTQRGEEGPNNPRTPNTQAGQSAEKEKVSPWPGQSPDTENSKNVNRTRKSFVKQIETSDENKNQKLPTQCQDRTEKSFVKQIDTLDENHNEKIPTRYQDGQHSGQSPVEEKEMVARRACNHPKHRARIYVGQPINKHQDMTASGTTQG